MGAILRVVSTDDGSPITDYRLASKPVFDGLSAAQGKLFIVTEDGEVICMAGAAASESDRRICLSLPGSPG